MELRQRQQQPRPYWPFPHAEHLMSMSWHQLRRFEALYAAGAANTKDPSLKAFYEYCRQIVSKELKARLCYYQREVTMERFWLEFLSEGSLEQLGYKVTNNKVSWSLY